MGTYKKKRTIRKYRKSTKKRNSNRRNNVKRTYNKKRNNKKYSRRKYRGGILAEELTKAKEGLVTSLDEEDIGENYSKHNLLSLNKNVTKLRNKLVSFAGKVNSNNSEYKQIKKKLLDVKKEYEVSTKKMNRFYKGIKGALKFLESSLEEDDVEKAIEMAIKNMIKEKNKDSSSLNLLDSPQILVPPQNSIVQSSGEQNQPRVETGIPMDPPLPPPLPEQAQAESLGLFRKDDLTPSSPKII